MTSSIYPLALSINATTITANTDILSTDLAITADMVKPGGGGILRLSFSYVFTSPAIASVRNGGAFKGNLNADNNSQIVTNGFYRFDIDVEAGDTLNLRLDADITTINFLRAHLVQFGA